MASRLDKLKEKQLQNKRSEMELNNSFDLEESSNTPVSKGDNAPKPVETKNKSKDTEVKEKAQSKTKEITEAASEDVAKKAEKTNKTAKTIKPIITIKENEPEKNLGIRLLTDEDKKYLSWGALEKRMTQKAFFVEIMLKEWEMTAKKPIALDDSVLSNFRDSSLVTTAITIAVPESVIEEIKKQAADHRMKYQRYIAYVVHKAKENDKTWNVK